MSDQRGAQCGVGSPVCDSVVGCWRGLAGTGEQRAVSRAPREVNEKLGGHSNTDVIASSLS